VGRQDHIGRTGRVLEDLNKNVMKGWGGTMKTNRMMKMCSALVAVTLAGSVTMADDHGRDRGDYRRHGGDGGRSYRGNYEGGRHHGYYHSPRSDVVFGLLGMGLIASAVACAERPVYVRPAPVVVREPQVVYIQQPAVIQVEPPQPAMVTINIQNSNGSYTPVTLRPAGSQWVGPRGEYYDSMPTVGQLRQVYGF
jgi:hypothetical protein